MVSAEQALANRALRTIRSELEFLADSEIIASATLQSILSQLPESTSSSRMMASPPPQTGRGKLSNTPAPPPLVSPSPPVAAPAPSYSYPTYSPPTAQMSNASLNEKAPQPSPAPSMPPPAYGAGPPVLGTASALYPYIPTDAGDLELQPGDRVQVLEHMNNDWWRGRSERSNQEGIFPRAYVNPLDDKAKGMPPPPPLMAPVPMPAPMPAPAPSGPMSYGNMPMEVAQQPTGSGRHSRFGDTGKKFGKKLGNAAIFGAGATAGADLVNSIF